MVKDLEKENKLIIVENNKMFLYEKGILIKTLDDIHIGTNGLSNEKVEGDLCTPKGLYNIGFAFGTKKINVNYPYYIINDNMYWVSDSDNEYYNEFVEITNEEKEYPYNYMNTNQEITWNDAEHLIDYPIEYELALVIEYNINPKIPKKGSAIFFHIKNKETTSGCISTNKENMLYIINWLDKNTKAKILIK